MKFVKLLVNLHFNDKKQSSNNTTICFEFRSDTSFLTNSSFKANSSLTSSSGQTQQKRILHLPIHFLLCITGYLHKSRFSRLKYLFETLKLVEKQCMNTYVTHGQFMFQQPHEIHRLFSHYNILFYLKSFQYLCMIRKLYNDYSSTEKVISECNLNLKKIISNQEQVK